MKKFVFFAAFLAGCTSQPRLFPQQPMPLTTASVLSSQMAMMATQTNLLFSYPPDMTNFLWDLQSSTNLVDWQTIASNFSGLPGGIYEVTNSKPQEFFRMLGHH